MAEEGDRVRLRGGEEVVLRPLEPGDRDSLRDGFRRLGDRSRYERFLAPKPDLTARELAYLTDVDHVDHEAIAAVDAATGEGVGVARYVRLREDPGLAEAAVAVVDAWQGRGLGSLLLDRLVERARVNGVARFRASMLVTNHAVQHLFARIGRVEVLRVGDGAIDADVELPVDPPALRMTLRSAARRECSLAERQPE
jgi:GNAT superfamily N-acetyltransferase